MGNAPAAAVSQQNFSDGVNYYYYYYLHHPVAKEGYYEGREKDIQERKRVKK